MAERDAAGYDGHRSLIRPGSEDAALEFLWHRHMEFPHLTSPANLAILRKKGKLPDVAVSEKEDEITRAIKEREQSDGGRKPLHIDEYLSRCPDEWHKEWKDKEILSKYWIPDDPGEMSDDFVQFVSSTHERFCDMKPYKGFFLYLMQWKRWMAEDEWAHNYSDDYLYNKFVDKEFARIKVHTGYFGEKYAKIKDGDQEGGVLKWRASLALMYILFLVDCKRSFYAIKARQIAFTSTIGVALICKSLTRKNLIVKFVAQSEDKSAEIFRDKFKPTMEMLDDIWGVTSIPNDRGKLLRVSFEESVKGRKNTGVSTIEVIAPRADAINGGAPSIVALDEMAFTPLFGAMVKEARPTRFAFDPVTGKLKLKRQVMAWTTGGEDARGGGSFEAEYRSVLSKWQKRDFSEKVVPIFLDWTCRIGITREFYEERRLEYAAGEGDGMSDKSVEECLVQFAQHYPSSIEDCFLSSRDTLVPYAFIEKNIRKIQLQTEKARIEYNEPLVTIGRFDPIYNTSVPMQEGSYFTHQVVGSNWLPMSEYEHLAPVSIFMHPRRRMRDIYFKGTDPVEAEATTSKQSSVVWDAHMGTIPAIMNQRANDPKRCFEQSALMNLYYGADGEFIPELIENNIGQSYINFIRDQHFVEGRTAIVTQWQLPEYLRTKTAINDGINVKGNTRLRVIDHLMNLLIDHGEKIYHMDLWKQLLHFLPVGGETTKRYRSEDTSKYNDDILMAAAFSYICRLCYPNRVPYSLDEQEREQRILVPELMQDANGELYYGYDMSPREISKERIRAAIAVNEGRFKHVGHGG